MRTRLVHPGDAWYADPMSTSEEQTRQIAIDHHHDAAGRFESNYRAMSQSRFANAFTYGRAKVDVLLEQELQRLQPGATVLDVGCGTGVYLTRFRELGFTPVGIEPAIGMLDIARRDNPDLRIEQGVATDLPFDDASFDFVSMIEVLRYLHLDDTRDSLNEAFRVLKPGGILFVTMVNRWALDGFYLLQRARQIALRSRLTREHPHCEFFTPAEVTSELANAGFESIRTEGRLFAPMRMVYKVNKTLAGKVAQFVEPYDDLLHGLSFTKPFAGHLVAVASRPR